METYWISLLVTIEQERAIQVLFDRKNWQFNLKVHVENEGQDAPLIEHGYSVKGEALEEEDEAPPDDLTSGWGDQYTEDDNADSVINTSKLLTTKVFFKKRKLPKMKMPRVVPAKALDVSSGTEKKPDVSSTSSVGNTPAIRNSDGKTPDVSSNTGKIPDVSSNTGKIPDVSSNAGKVPDVSSNAGKIPDVSSNAGKIPDESSIAGKIPHVSSNAGKVPDESSIAGKIPHVSSIAGITPDVISSIVKAAGVSSSAEMAAEVSKIPGKGSYFIVTRRPVLRKAKGGPKIEKSTGDVIASENVAHCKIEKLVTDQVAHTGKRKLPSDFDSANEASPAVITEQVKPEIDYLVAAMNVDAYADEDEKGFGNMEESNEDAVSDSMEDSTTSSPSKCKVIVRKKPVVKADSDTAGYFVNEDGNVVVKVKNEFQAVLSKHSKKITKRELETIPGIEHVSELGNTERVNLDTELRKDVKKDGFVMSLSKYFCVDCEYLFQKQGYYDGHKRKGACVFDCKECLESFTFRNYTAYEKHCQDHRIEKKKIAREKKILNKSEPKIKLPIELLCQTCGQRFTSRTGYSDHMRRLHGGKEAPYNCCNIAFLSKTHYQRHRCRIHHDPTPFLCELCGADFPIEGDLKRHVLLHETDKFTCKKCGAKLPFQGAFTDHMAMHNKEQNHHCLCGKKFTHRTSLSKHRRYCQAYVKEAPIFP